MKVVIDISENDYWLACNHPEALIGVYAQAIKKGVILPKGHGRLIDADAFIATMRDASKRQKYKELLIGDYLTVDDVFESIIASLQNEGLAEGDAPTIIEADTTRDCKTCGHSNDGKSAGTEECHKCMWVNNYIKADTGE